jgi:Asp-tRNA(Asn)/Glu-tRNA(Gln) amidotransferase A subunit family amidase
VKLFLSVVSRSWVERAKLAVALGVVYFVTARFSFFVFRVEPGVAVFWPASGIAVGALIAFGPRARLPITTAVFVATLAHNLLVGRNPWLTIAFGMASLPRTRPWAAEVRARLTGLRIAVSTHTPASVALHTDCAEAVRVASKLCRELGHVVDEARPPLDAEAISNALRVIMRASVRTLVDARAATLGRAPTQGDLEPVTWDRYYTSSETAADYARALATLHRATRELAAFQEHWDVILTPMLAQPPVRLGEIVHSGPNAAYFADRVREFSPFSTMANWAGVPAMSVPLHWSAGGLPIGVQFIGRFGDEGTLFCLAAQLEKAKPWAKRRPSL